MTMSTDPDVEKLAKALRTDQEARDAVVDAIVGQMNVDPDTAEGQAAQSYRRDVLKALGVLGTGAAIGGGAHQALTEPAAASHGAGSVGEAGNPINTAYVTSISGDGDRISVSPGIGPADAEKLTMSDSGHGPIVSKQVADVVVYYGVETDERSDFYVRAVNQNGVVDEFVGDVVGSGGSTTKVFRSALSAAENTNTRRNSGLVRIISNSDRGINFKNPDTASDPFFVVPENVTVDARGTSLKWVEDASAAWELRQASAILAHGADWELSSSGNGPDCTFLLDGDAGSSSSNAPVRVFGFPVCRAPKASRFAVEAVQTGGGSVSHAHIEVGVRNGSGIFTATSSGTGGFVNGNNVYVTGSASGGSTRGGSGTSNLVETIGTEDAHFNEIYCRDLQCKTGGDDVGRFETGQKNAIFGTIHDMGNVSNGYTLTSGVAGPCTLTRFYGSVAVTNNSGVAHYFPIIAEKTSPQDLTTLSGEAGMVILHDGTDGASAVPYGPAVWDPNKASGAGNWVSMIDGTVFGPN